MKIGIMSDSHRRLDLTKFVIDNFLDKKVDFIIHGGDIVEEKCLKMLEKTNLPYCAILGNNDNHLIKLRKKFSLHKEPHIFKLKNYKVKLMHHPFYLKPDADIIVYGHTHYFACDYVKKSLIINPGEVCARKKYLCEWAILEEQKDSWKVIRCNKNPDKKKINEKILEYKK